MTATWCLALLPLVIAAAPLAAQSEADLQQHFEGKRVTLKIAMPGTEAGVDIYPVTDRPLDYPRYATRLKDNGTAIRSGDDAMITKIRVKSSHIEFQLDGGGYGTMSDETSTTVTRGVHSQEQAGEESGGRARAGEGPGPAAGDQGGAGRSASGPASGRTPATAPKSSTPRSRRSRTSGSDESKAGHGSTSATATACRTRCSRRRAWRPRSRIRHLPLAAGQRGVLERSRPWRRGDIGATPAPSGGLPRKGMTVSEVDGLLGRRPGKLRAVGGKPSRRHSDLPVRRRARHRGIRRGRAVPLLGQVRLSLRRS